MDEKSGFQGFAIAKLIFPKNLYIKSLQIFGDVYWIVRWGAAYELEKIGSLTVLESLIKSPDINLYDDIIFPMARRLAIKYSKSGASFIPVYCQNQDSSE